MKIVEKERVQGREGEFEEYCSRDCKVETKRDQETTDERSGEKKT